MNGKETVEIERMKQIIASIKIEERNERAAGKVWFKSVPEPLERGCNICSHQEVCELRAIINKYAFCLFFYYIPDFAYFCKRYSKTKE